MGLRPKVLKIGRGLGTSPKAAPIAARATATAAIRETTLKAPITGRLAARVVQVLAPITTSTAVPRWRQGARRVVRTTPQDKAGAITARGVTFPVASEMMEAAMAIRAPSGREGRR